MDRRHFLQISGAALGGLIVLSATGTAAGPTETVELPAQVFVQLDGGTQALTSKDRTTWTYRDVVVRLVPQSGGALLVAVQSPTTALHAVQLQWKYPQDPTATVLGDAWERTYGDVQFQPAAFARRLPWYLVQHDPKNHRTACFGVKTGCRTLCYWQVGDGKMQLTLDTSSAGVGVQLGPRTLDAATVLATTGHPPADTTGDRWQFQLFDTLLLDIMQRRGERTRDIFRQLFERNPVERIFRFLDEQTSWTDNLRVMNSVAPGPFMRSIGQVLRGRPGRRE